MSAKKKPAGVFRYAIGDIHGRSFWKACIRESYSELYFTGDYFDSFDILFEDQYRNFIEIIEEAKANKRIKMCLGNHDYHYIYGVEGQRYSGYQKRHSSEIGAIFEENMDLFNIVYTTDDNYIISHAGVTSWFLESIGGENPEDINRIFKEDRTILKFNGNNIYGDDITQSPIWVRPKSLKADHLPGYNQIVGHTPRKNITRLPATDGTELVFIDTLGANSIYRF